MLKPDGNPSNNKDQMTTQAAFTCRSIHDAGAQCPAFYTFNDTSKQVPDDNLATFIAECCVSGTVFCH